MKGDVLSGIKTIKVCTHYKIQKKVIDYFPFDIQSESVTPQYVDIPGWEEDLSELKKLMSSQKIF